MTEMMNLNTLRDKRAEDVNNGRNSLSWIVPIAQHLVRHMTSDELYFFVMNRVVRKKADLEHKLLNVTNEEEEIK